MFAFPQPPPRPSDFGRAVSSTFKGWGRQLGCSGVPHQQRGDSWKPPPAPLSIHALTLLRGVTRSCAQSFLGEGDPLGCPLPLASPHPSPGTDRTRAWRRKVEGGQVTWSSIPFSSDCVCIPPTHNPFP